MRRPTYFENVKRVLLKSVYKTTKYSKSKVVLVDIVDLYNNDAPMGSRGFGLVYLVLVVFSTVLVM